MSEAGRPDVSPIRAVTIHALWLVAGMAAILSAALAWDINLMKNAHLERARLQAALVIDEDRHCREWLAAPASGASLKNPHLIGRRIRDSRRAGGAPGERKHLVGRSGPFCDAWEKAALETFERGETTAAEGFAVFDGVSYFRMMRPLDVKPSCLGCHKDFKPGGVGGAIAVALPTAPLWEIQRRRIRQEVLTHTAVGAAALGLIVLLYLRLKNDLDKVRVLKGILPICTFCKNIRDESGDWHQLESFVRDRSQAIFSHGLCADCFEKNYPDYYLDAKRFEEENRSKHGPS